MLTQLHELETYFGKIEGAQSISALVQNFSTDEVKAALERGDVKCRSCCCGSDNHEVLVYLSQKGRESLTQQP